MGINIGKIIAMNRRINTPTSPLSVLDLDRWPPTPTPSYLPRLPSAIHSIWTENDKMLIKRKVAKAEQLLDCIEDMLKKVNELLADIVATSTFEL
jgi:hypothetical protein